MKVYLMKADRENYSSLELRSGSHSPQDMVRLAGLPVEENWRKPTLVIHHPERQRGNFFALGPGAFVIDREVHEKIGYHFHYFSELLPVEVEGMDGDFYAVNIVDIRNALDHNRSTTIRGKCHERGWQGFDPILKEDICIEHFVFHEDRLGGAKIFKLPELPEQAMFYAQQAVFREEGEYAYYGKYKVRKETVGDEELEIARTDLAEEFISKIKEHGLRGLAFEELFESEI